MFRTILNTLSELINKAYRKPDGLVNTLKFVHKIFVAVVYNSPLIKIVTSESQRTPHFKVSNQPVIAYTHSL